MSRSGYCEDINQWALIRWRGAVNSAINGKRGQAFLKEMLSALDSLPEKKLVSDELITPSGEVCAIGSVMAMRGISVEDLDVYNAEQIASTMGISQALVREIEFINDDAHSYDPTVSHDEKRYRVVRNWVVSQIKEQV